VIYIENFILITIYKKKNYL